MIAATLCCFLCLPEEGLPASGQKVIQYVEFNPTYAPWTGLWRRISALTKMAKNGIGLTPSAILGPNTAEISARYQAKDMDALFQALDEGETIETLTEKMEHYAYYREAYGAVLDGLVGEYREEKEQDGQTVWQDCYGLKRFSLWQGFLLRTLQRFWSPAHLWLYPAPSGPRHDGGYRYPGGGH